MLTSSLTVITKLRKRIAIFRGSFDPPHQGHRDIVECCLNMGFDKVYIIGNELNRYKLERTDYAKRKEMMKRAFAGLQNVKIMDDTAVSLVSCLREKSKAIQIVGVMGIDGVEIGIRKPEIFSELNVDSWLIMPRAQHESLKFPEVIGGKKLKYVDASHFTHIGFSSTAIRQYLASHGGFYTSGDLPREFGVDEENVNYIRAQMLYRDYRAEIKKGFSDHSNILSKTIDWNSLRNCTSQLGGFSSDIIYLANDIIGNLAIVIKVFTGVEKEKNLKNEVTAIAKLQEFKLETCYPIPCLYSSSNDNCSFMVMPVAQGTKFTDFMEAVKNNVGAEREFAMARLKAATKLLAKSQTELHCKVTAPIKRLEQDEMQWFTSKIDKIYQSLVDKHCHYPSLDIHLLCEYIDKTKKNFFENPGQYAFTHGDPNLNNFFIDMGAGHVTYLDNAHLIGKWTDAQGQPKGFAENEFCETLSVFSLIGRRLGLDEEAIAASENAYSEAYAENVNSNFRETAAFKFFKLFWILRTLNIPLKALENYTGRQEYEVKAGLLDCLIEHLKLEIGEKASIRYAFN